MNKIIKKYHKKICKNLCFPKITLIIKNENKPKERIYPQYCSSFYHNILEDKYIIELFIKDKDSANILDSYIHALIQAFMYVNNLIIETEKEYNLIQQIVMNKQQIVINKIKKFL